MKLNNLKDLNEKIKKLKDGDLLILPTDTVYGIGVKISDLDNFNKNIENIYKIKNRSFDKKIILLLDDINRIYEICDLKNIDEKILHILTKFMPGKLSVILKTNKKFKEKTSYDTIGVRVPNSYITRYIINNLGGIMFVSSANISGMEATNDFTKLDNRLIQSAKLVIEENIEYGGTPSTILDYSNKEIKILREGEITEEMIKEFYENYSK